MFFFLTLTLSSTLACIQPSPPPHTPYILSLTRKQKPYVYLLMQIKSPRNHQIMACANMTLGYSCHVLCMTSSFIACFNEIQTYYCCQGNAFAYPSQQPCQHVCVKDSILIHVLLLGSLLNVSWRTDDIPNILTTNTKWVSFPISMNIKMREPHKGKTSMFSLKFKGLRQCL